MKQTRSSNIETLVVDGIITGTSDKQSKDFEVKEPRKTVYFSAKNDVERKKLLDFGLQEYETRETKEKFFIIKTSENVKVGDNTLDCSVDVDGEGANIKYTAKTKNFSSDGGVVSVAIMKGESQRNKFYRLYAIKGRVVPNASVDPFANIESDIEEVEIDLNEFVEKNNSDNTLDISADDLPF